MKMFQYAGFKKRDNLGGTMNKTLTFLNQVVKENTTIVLGLSGGPDSICLFHMLVNIQKKKKIKIICAHVNHNVRQESEKEEKFVKKICEQNNCLFETIKLNIDTKNNFESKARKERYNFFDKIVNKYHAGYLMTAHHGDDLMETILMHITRGSNLRGYAGFRKITTYPQFKLIRPLIHMSKEEILSYCKDNSLKYCMDKSNESDTYTRNRYRKYIIPFLKKEYKNVHRKYLKFSERLEEIEEYLKKNTEIALTKVYDFDKVNLRELNKCDLLIKRRVIEYILKEEYQDDILLINEKHIDAILHICEIEKPNIVLFLPLKKKIVKEYNTMYFCNKENKPSKEYILDDFVKISDTEIIKKLEDTNIEKSNFIIRLDSNEIALPLKLRTRKEKDEMAIKNLNGTKKIKDIFINEKVPKTRRDTYPIIVDNNDTILWLPGLKKSKFDKNKNEFYDIIYKYVISEEKNNEKK